MESSPFESATPWRPAPLLERPAAEGRGYRPLRDYALVGDGRTAALVARDGSVDWCCLPRFDAPAVLCRLLDARRGGFFRVAPVGRWGSTRAYVGDSNVLATDFETARGCIRLTDVMPVDTPGGPLLLRRVEGLAGEVEVAAELWPTFDFARAGTRWDWHDVEAVARGAGQALRLRGPVRWRTGRRGEAVSRFRVRAGERRWVMLTPDVEAPTDLEAEALLEGTRRHWESWVSRGSFPGAYAGLLRRSALTLRMLRHTPTGALVAAPTTSLPEELGGVRNWDFRYTWPRDAAWVVDSLLGLGFLEESTTFLAWLESLGLGEHGPSVLYRVDGSKPDGEEELPHLEGYRGARPVRVGNAAGAQSQLDILGEVINAVCRCASDDDAALPLTPGLWRMVRNLADLAARRWREPDESLWEMRCGPRHFLASKLMCWVALDRALRLAERHRLDGPGAVWLREREALREAIETRGWNARVGAFTQAFGEPALDATGLLVPVVGFLPATDARVLATLERVQRELGSGALMRRYTMEDGLPGSEGAFALCSFWRADALMLAGRKDEAGEVFEAAVRHANDVGLLSEEVDLETGALLGNFPQGLTHLALIRSGLLLEGVAVSLA